MRFWRVPNLRYRYMESRVDCSKVEVQQVEHGTITLKGKICFFKGARAEGRKGGIIRPLRSLTMCCDAVTASNELLCNYFSIIPCLLRTQVVLSVCCKVTGIMAVLICTRWFLSNREEYFLDYHSPAQIESMVILALLLPIQFLCLT